MDIISVITLVTGIILAFSGAIMVIVSSQQKSRVDRIEGTTCDHATRLTYLEKRDAVTAQEFKTILEKIGDLTEMIREHIHEGRT